MDTRRSESCAFTQQEVSCMSNVAAPCTLKKGTGREHTGQKVEDTKRRSLHDRGSLTCSNSAPSLPACWSHSACEQPPRPLTNKRERLFISDPQKQSFSACDMMWTVFVVQILCLPCETAVVCNVNEALPGCVNGLI